MLRPVSPRTATTSEPFLHQPLERARLMGLPPMGLSGLSGFALCGHTPAPPPGPRQGRATSSPMVGTLGNLMNFQISVIYPSFVVKTRILLS